MNLRKSASNLLALLIEEQLYRLLQQTILIRPEVGDLIRGSGGLRKIRWNLPGRGKRGGLRVIYYWDEPEDTVYRLLPYKKSKQEDLTPTQLKVLRDIIKKGLE